jgi:hypothetical protein
MHKEPIMSHSKNFEDYFPNGQSLRSSALHYQLLALDGQLQVLQALDLEHSLGVQSSTEAALLLQHARDLVKSVETIAHRAKSASKESTMQSLLALRDATKRLGDRAQALDRNGLDRAKLRLDQCLSEHPQVPGPSVEGIVPADAEKLTVKAGISCYRAEVNQFDTFALQIKALCDLALEFAYNSAVESPAFSQQ